MKTLMIPATLLALAAPALAQEETTMTMDEVPPSVMEAALAEKLGAADFTAVATDDGVYEFAGSTDEAAACLEAGRIRAILLDEATARAEGDPVEVVTALAARAGGARISLLWSAAAAQTDRDALLARGATQVIVKPVTGAALAALLFRRKGDGEPTGTLVSEAA